MHIKLSDRFTSWPLLRQTPGSRGVWGNCEFFVNKEVQECDYWVVYEGLKAVESTHCPPQNTILITGEPPTIKRYPPGFLAQFGTVITCHTDMNHPHIIHNQQSQPWHAGIIRMLEGENIVKLDYDYFRSLKESPKNKLISVICSSKSMTKGHRQRVRFVEKLRRRFGQNIDVFGNGFDPIPDKWDAIYPYKYHIVLENCSISDYWTEKLADAFLGLTYPIYYGCTNLSGYFPDKSFTPIDITKPDQAISIIEGLIEDEIYERSIKYIMEANSLILNRYNLFPMLAQLCNEIKPSPCSVETVKIKPESAFIHPLSKMYRFLVNTKNISTRGFK